MNEESDIGSDSDPSGDNMDSKELMSIIQKSEARKAPESKVAVIRKKKITKAPKRMVMKLPQPLPALNPQDRVAGYNAPGLVDLLESATQLKYGYNSIQRHFLNSSNESHSSTLQKRTRTVSQRSNLKASTTNPKSNMTVSKSKYKDYGYVNQNLSRTEYGNIHGQRESVIDIPLIHLLSVIGNNTSHIPSSYYTPNTRRLTRQEVTEKEQCKYHDNSPSKRYLAPKTFSSLHRPSCSKNEKMMSYNKRQASISLKSKASFSWYDFTQGETRVNARATQYIPRGGEYPISLFSHK